MNILVTGSSGGIGGAFAAAASGRHNIIHFNRRDFAALKSNAASVLADVPPLDALVFATGCCPVAPLSKTSDVMFAETFDTNCGLFLALMRKIVADRLYSTSGMRVVAISSISANEGWAGGAAYCASKGALSALCRALDAELKPRGISVMALEPRYVKTKMFDACAGRMGVSPSLAAKPEEFAASILSAIS